MVGSLNDEEWERRRRAIEERARIVEAERARFQAWADAVGIPTFAAWTPDGWTRDAANSLPLHPVWERQDERGVLRAFPSLGPPKGIAQLGAPIAYLAVGLGEDDSGATLHLEFAAAGWPKALATIARWLEEQGPTVRRQPPRRD